MPASPLPSDGVVEQLHAFRGASDLDAEIGAGDREVLQRDVAGALQVKTSWPALRLPRLSTEGA